MKTIDEACFKIESEIVRLASDGRPRRIVQIEAVLCEDYHSVMLYATIVPDDDLGGLPLYACFDLPRPMGEAEFDEVRRGFESRLCASGTVH